MAKTKIQKAILALVILLVLLSSYNYILSYSSVCLIGDATSCSDVQNSEYGSILGIKVSILGVIAFILLFIAYLGATLKNKYKDNFYEIFLVGIVIGTIASIYFILLQIFVLKTTCINCMLIDSAMLILAALVFINHRKQKRR